MKRLYDALINLCDSFDIVEENLLNYIEKKNISKARLSKIIGEHKETIKKIEKILKEENK